jgi:predicted nucleic acid-binding protein
LTILVDSSVWIDYFNGTPTAETDYLDQILGWRDIVVGDLILAEVLQGFRQEKEFYRARNALLKFRVASMVGTEIALQSAMNYRFLRSQGITIRKTMDCLIATFCIENELHLLHSDRDFNQIATILPLAIQRP